MSASSTAIWLGLPFVLAGAASRLELLVAAAADGLAVAAVVIGVVVLVLGIIGTDGGSDS